MFFLVDFVWKFWGVFGVVLEVGWRVVFWVIVFCLGSFRLEKLLVRKGSFEF